MGLCPKQWSLEDDEDVNDDDDMIMLNLLKVGVMMRKYKMSEEEIKKIWDEFYAKHPDGFMTKESFLDTKEVYI